MHLERVLWLQCMRSTPDATPGPTSITSTTRLPAAADATNFTAVAFSPCVWGGDADVDEVFVAQRNPAVEPILVFTREGRFVRGFGGEAIASPHGIAAQTTRHGTPDCASSNLAFSISYVVFAFSYGEYS